MDLSQIHDPVGFLKVQYSRCDVVDVQAALLSGDNGRLAAFEGSFRRCAVMVACAGQYGIGVDAMVLPRRSAWVSVDGMDAKDDWVVTPRQKVRSMPWYSALSLESWAVRPSTTQYSQMRSGERNFAALGVSLVDASGKLGTTRLCAPLLPR
jgi:hypothetical protein